MSKKYIKLELKCDSQTLAFHMADLGGRDHVVAEIGKRGLGAYEEPYPLLLALFAMKRRGAFLDVGANTGVYALLAAAARPDIVVHAFEPLDSIAALLAANRAHNPNLGPRIRVHHLALSDQTGEATFYETVNPHGLVPTSSGLDRDFAESIGGLRQSIVPTSRLDDWVARNGVSEIAFVKIDVESHEAAVLAGAERVAAELRPVFGVEMLGDANFAAISAFMARHDYVDAAMEPGALTFGLTPRFRPLGWNHLLVPAEQVAPVMALAAPAGLDMRCEDRGLHARLAAGMPAGAAPRLVEPA